MSRTRHHGNKQKRRIYGNDWHWLQNYPKWWDREFHTKPRRARERHGIHLAIRGEYEQVWPLDHKPHVYYW